MNGPMKYYVTSIPYRKVITGKEYRRNKCAYS